MTTQTSPSKLKIKLIYNSPKSMPICSSPLEAVSEPSSPNSMINLTPSQVPKLRLIYSPKKPTLELSSIPKTPSPETSSQADSEKMVIPAKQLAELLKAVLVKDIKTSSKLQMVKVPTQFVAMMFTPGLIQLTTQKNGQRPTTEAKAKQSLKRKASEVLDGKKQNPARPINQRSTKAQSLSQEVELALIRSKKRRSELAQSNTDESSPPSSPTHSLGPPREYRSSGWTCMNRPAPKVTVASLLETYQYPAFDDQPLEEVRRNAAFDDYGKH